MKAAYMLASAAQIAHFQTLDEDALIEALDQAEVQNPDHVVYVDDNWDVIHFLLTGRSTAEPVADNGLSEAVVGVNWFDEEDEAAAFLAWSSAVDCKRIHDAVRKISAEELPIAADPEELSAAGVYGAEAFANEAEWALEQLMLDFADLQAHYHRAAQEGQAMVVSFL